jgi:hypothetical protein
VEELREDVVAVVPMLVTIIATHEEELLECRWLVRSGLGSLDVCHPT